jgi:hypothetical protein
MWLPLDEIKEKNISDALLYFDEAGKDSFDDMKQLMSSEKIAIRSYAKNNIEQQMYENARFYKLTYGKVDKKVVKNMEDLKQVYKEATIEEDHERVWKVCVGYFDAEREWFARLAHKYMQMRKWKYTERDIDKGIRSGFVSRIMQQVYREIIRRVRYSNKEKVVGGLRKSRPKELITEKTKYRRRKHGQYEEFMAGIVTEAEVRLFLCIATNNCK